MPATARRPASATTQAIGLCVEHSTVISRPGLRQQSKHNRQQVGSGREARQNGQRPSAAATVFCRVSILRRRADSRTSAAVLSAAAALASSSLSPFTVFKLSRTSDNSVSKVRTCASRPPSSSPSGEAKTMETCTGASENTSTTVAVGGRSDMVVSYQAVNAALCPDGADTTFCHVWTDRRSSMHKACALMMTPCFAVSARAKHRANTAPTG